MNVLVKKGIDAKSFLVQEAENLIRDLKDLINYQTALSYMKSPRYEAYEEDNKPGWFSEYSGE